MMETLTRIAAFFSFGYCLGLISTQFFRKK
jgi:hypothetical protein